MASLNQKTSVLGKRLAAHLLKRTTYHITKQRVETFAMLTPTQAIDQLFVPYTFGIDEPEDYELGGPWLTNGATPILSTSKRRNIVRGWWLNEVRQDTSIVSKMQIMLHTNFVTATKGFGNDYHFFFHLALLRFYALGNFKTLAKKIALDNLMLIYLDNRYNLKDSPNENFAREFLELFTIGKGEQIEVGNYTNYTEYDIQQAAKVLTGFRTSSNDDIGVVVDADTGIFKGKNVFNQHDLDDKTFSAAFQNTTITAATDADDMDREWSDFVEMVFAQAETAKTFVRKIYRFFVSRHIDAEIETDIIEPLSDVFRNNDYEIAPVLRQLLESEHFYDEDDADSNDEIIGGMIKSPLELVLGTMNWFGIQPPDLAADAKEYYIGFYSGAVINTMMTLTNLNLFNPPDVAGYPAYYQAPDYHRAWFNTTSIIGRYKMPEMFLTGKRIIVGGNLGGVTFDVMPWIVANISAPVDATILVTEMLDSLIPEISSTERFDYFLNVLLDDLSPINWQFEWQNFENTNDDTAVRIPLENLFRAITVSQEYQLM